MPGYFKKRPTAPREEEQIRPEALVRVIKKEKPTDGEQLKDIPVEPKNYRKFQGETDARGLPRGIFWAIAGLVVLFAGGFIISFYVVKQKVKDSMSSQIGAFQAGVAHLQNFDPKSAENSFALLSASSTADITGLMGVFGFLFQGGTGVAGSFGDLGKQLWTLSQEATSLQVQVFNFIGNGGQGGNLIAELTSLRDTLGAIDTDSDQLSGAASAVGGLSSFGFGDFYLPLKAKVGSAKNFLDAFIPWLSGSASHHVLVLLQNPSEIKPAGGFLGSYADITIASGTITSVSVHDIADVDSAFKENIIPPKPLQLEITRFRPADANWFFDFPTSASETISFFERSGLYSGLTTPQHPNATTSPTLFDGAIAISPNVISDLLNVTGPITLSSTPTLSKGTSLTFASSTFMVQIQNIVQQGQAASQNGEATYPKAVLGQLSQAIFQSLASSTDAQKQALLLTALNWIGKKDVMAYFKDPDFQNFLASYGAIGDVYQLPQNFNGEYLALVDANIRGDKSDLYVAQKVNFDAQINADGVVNDHLVIDHTHRGNKSPYWWYQTTNQDYLQVFVQDGISLTNETGGIKKTITPPTNYLKNGYSTDPAVLAIESSTQTLFGYPAVIIHQESGKEVFATWAQVAKGKTTEVTFDYTHRLPLTPVDGMPFQFVFEKQAGTKRSYDLSVDAPLGYVFAENNLASYEYISDDPPGRLIVDLTLKKL